MTPVEFPFQLLSTPSFETSDTLNHARRIAERLSRGQGILGLDVDGVLLDGSSIEGDQLTDPAIATILPNLEKKLDIRLITARGASVISSMKQLIPQGLDLIGPHIIEEGHAWLMDGMVHPLVSQEYAQFFRTLREDLQNNGLKHSWQEVASTKNSFCWGDARWQGRYSGSLWFRYQDRGVMENLLKEKVGHFSDMASVSIDFHFNTQPQNDLAWMRIRSSEVNKAHRMHTLGLPDVYICDGPNDRQAIASMRPDILLPYMQNTHGMVIAIDSSPDKETADMRWVYEHADMTVHSHQELASLLKKISQFV